MQIKSVFVIAALATPSSVFATQDPTSNFEVLEAKITSAVQDKEAVDEKAAFQTGDKAWVWLKIRPAGEATMRLRYTVDGNPVWTSEPTAVRLGRSWFYKTLYYPGEWKVEIIDDSDRVMKEMAFSVSGEAVPIEDTQAEPMAEQAAAPAAMPAEAEAQAPAIGPSELAAVVELKLASEIQNREPMKPALMFPQNSKVFTWVKLHIKQAGGSHVKMRWFVDDKEVWMTEAIQVQESPSYRTWFQKTVDMPGNWRVEILDAEDHVLHSEKFTVN